jgi:hypothetical protein
MVSETQLGEHIVGAYHKLVTDCEVVSYNQRSKTEGEQMEIDVIGIDRRFSTEPTRYTGNCGIACSGFHSLLRVHGVRTSGRIRVSVVERRFGTAMTELLSRVVNTHLVGSNHSNAVPNGVPAKGTLRRPTPFPTGGLPKERVRRI